MLLLALAASGVCEGVLSLPIHGGGEIECIWVPVEAADGVATVAIGDFSEKQRNEKPREANIYGPFARGAVRGYYLGKTEVTESQWASVMGSGPRSKFPARQKTYAEIQVFLEKLNRGAAGSLPRTPAPDHTPGSVKLPTEAEWEYAARGGAGGRYREKVPYADTLERYEVFCDPASTGVKPVASRLPNSLGLHDMLGNVREWVEGSYSTDNKTGSGHVLRGGCYLSEATELRSSARTEQDPYNGRPDAGFRICISAPVITGLPAPTPSPAKPFASLPSPPSPSLPHVPDDSGGWLFWFLGMLGLLALVVMAGAFVMDRGPLSRVKRRKTVTDGSPKPRAANRSDAAPEIVVTLQQVLHGGVATVSVPDASGAGTRYSVKIPRGIREGQKLKLAGLGAAEPDGEGAGDCYLRVVYEAIPGVRIQGADVYREFELPGHMAQMGGTAEVRDLEGRTVRITIPAGTTNGSRFRIHQEGLPDESGQRGDFYAVAKLMP